MDNGRYVQTSVPGIVRDTQTGALINRNVGEFNAYINARDTALLQKSMNERLELVEQSVNEIKETLRRILDSNGN